MAATQYEALLHQQSSGVDRETSRFSFNSESGAGTAGPTRGSGSARGSRGYIEPCSVNVDSSEADERPRSDRTHLSGAQTFEWLNRDCIGTPLHLAALDDNIAEMKRILDEKPGIVTSRFRYETKYQNVLQEGSGEAIHLCASRQSVAGVELLVEWRASLDAVVTRGHKHHYNVLHAAVFAEGRGGGNVMIRYLLDARAEIRNNLDGDSPLHKALQVAALDIVPLLRDAMEARSPGHTIETSINSEKDTPLEQAAKKGYLTEDQLSRIALPRRESLEVFMQWEPRCIKSFLSRPECQNLDLQSSVTVANLAKVMGQSPESACALLTYLSSEPVVEDIGWHRLPTRMSFAPRTTWEKIMVFANPMPRYKAFYEPDWIWRYNTKEFVMPEWHQELMDRSRRPIRDISVQVFRVKGIACAEFLLALESLSRDDDVIFEHPVTRGVLDVVWWNGASNQDLLQFILTVFGIFMMLLEFWLDTEDEDRVADARRLRHSSHGHTGGGGMGEVDLGFRPIKLSGSDHFIVARGFVDLIREAAQFIGYARLGHGMRYCTLVNLYDIVFAVLPILFLWDDDNMVFRLGIILYYWTRLSSITFMERFSCELQPIHSSMFALFPASLVFLVGFVAITHMHTVLMPVGTNIWPDLIYDSYGLLMTAQLPSPAASPARLVFAIIFVTIFSVFFLNIFIGVMFESYLKEKKRVLAAFGRARCSQCLTFLLRSNVFPANRIPKGCALLIMALMAVIIIGLQIHSVVYRAVDEKSLGVAGTFVCMMITVLCSYQTPSIDWSNDGPPNYLWLANQSSYLEDDDEDEYYGGAAAAHQFVKEVRVSSSQLLAADRMAPATPLRTPRRMPVNGEGDMQRVLESLLKIEERLARLEARSGKKVC